MTSEPTAVYRGVAYRAQERFGVWPEIHLLVPQGGPAPAGLGPSAEEGDRAVFLVDPELCDAWYETRWTFRWRQEPFERTGTDAGRISGVYRGHDEEFAEEHLRRVFGGDLGGTFPQDEVTDLAEYRVDLLARRRASSRRMVEANMFRPGTFAQYRGRTYRADDEPDGLYRLTLHDDDSGRTEIVAVDALDACFTTRWTFNWCRGPFDANGADQGWLKGTYTGSSWGFVDNYFLDQETAPDGPHSVYTIHVKLDAVTDLTEHRTDLLAKWKEEHQR